ncbi:unnamed protein product [Ascophyllum nodosum]
MAVGENNFDRLKANALDWRPESAERIAWAQVFLSLLTQASSLAKFPSYNVVLGFWGLYSVFSKSLQATQVYIGLLFFSVILDITFCSIWGSNNAGIFDGNTAKFCLAMLILNMLVKCTAIYSFLRYYKELEAGVIHPPYNRSATRRRRPTKSEQGRALAGGGSTYDMEPMSPGEEEAPIGSPQGTASLFSAGSAASFALSPKRRDG